MQIPKIDKKFKIENYPFKLIDSNKILLRIEELENKIPKELRTMDIPKKSFINRLDHVVNYINYFCKYFDEDDELVAGYMMLIYAVINNQINLPLENFMYNLLSIIGSKSMVEKICNMVEHNVGDVIKPSKKKVDPSIQITVEHYKAIMSLAILYKIIIPICSMYYKKRKDEIVFEGFEELPDKLFYFICFTQFIPLFDDKYDVDLYAKMYNTSTTRVSKTAIDAKMWERRKYYGEVPTSQASKLMRDLFVDLTRQAVFDQNAINFIHVCFDKSNKHYLVQKDRYDLSEMSMDSGEDEDMASAFDNMQMENARFSILHRNRAITIIEDTIEDVCDRYSIHIRKKDIKFYEDNYKFNSEIQKKLIKLFFASYTGSYEMLSFMRSVHYIKVMIIMKEVLRGMNFRFLPHLISGRIDKIKSRRYSRKRLEKFIKDHPRYPELRAEFTHAGNNINTDRLIEDLRDLVSAKVYVVDHELADEMDKHIDLNRDDSYQLIADEIVRFVISL